MTWDYSRSREGAWIEIQIKNIININISRRSREGAWIEIIEDGTANISLWVAPVRERGLKYAHNE